MKVIPINYSVPKNNVGSPARGTPFHSAPLFLYTFFSGNSNPDAPAVSPPAPTRTPPHPKREQPIAPSTPAPASIPRPGATPNREGTPCYPNLCPVEESTALRSFPD